MLNRLRGRVDPLLIDVLWELLGNCAAPLEHRGPITLNFQTPTNLLNADGSINTDIAGPGGTALHIIGGMNVTGPSAFQSPTTGEFLGAIRYATAVADWEANSGNPRVAVLGQVGNRIAGFWVYLPHMTCEAPNVQTGDTVYYAMTAENVAVAPWYGSNAPRAAVALDDWEDNGGDPRVAVQLTLGGAQQNVWASLPCAASQDPAVFEDDSIWVKRTDSGLWIAEGYGDDKIGTVKMWTRAGITGAPENIPAGWRECLPGADFDLAGRFPVGRDPEDPDHQAIGETGGYTWHGGTENNHTDHANHRHYLDSIYYTTASVQAGSDHNVLIVGVDDLWTSGADKLSGGDDLNWDHNGPHDPAGGSATSDTDNRPKYKNTCFIERYK